MKKCLNFQKMREQKKAKNMLKLKDKIFNNFSFNKNICPQTQSITTLILTEKLSK